MLENIQKVQSRMNYLETQATLGTGQIFKRKKLLKKKNE